MEGAKNSKHLRITSSDVTRRELLAVTAVTGGALAGGQFMPGSRYRRRRRKAPERHPLRSTSCCASTEPSTG